MLVPSRIEGVKLCIRVYNGSLKSKRGRKMRNVWKRRGVQMATTYSPNLIHGVELIAPGQEFVAKGGRS